MLSLLIAGLLITVILIYLLCKHNTQKKGEQQEQILTDRKIEKKEEVIQLEETTPNNKQESKSMKKRKKQTEIQKSPSLPTKTPKQLQTIYGQHYYGSISLRSSKAISTITSISVKNSKILLGNSRNELVLYDLRKWKMHTPCSQQYFTSLDNNIATATAITPNHYYAALDFDKTIICFQFKGGEGGVYFQQVKKLPRGLFKSNQGTLHVPDGEQFIVSTGMEADTTINVWSMEGQKLAHVSTYQIEHYDVKYAASMVLVRGWTSEVKSFMLATDKNGIFSKIGKGFHLTHSEKPLASSIDNLGLHALTITGDGELIKLWLLNPTSQPVEKTIDSCQIHLDQPKHCSILTLRSQNERLRTIILVASDTKMVLLDRQLKLLKQFQGVSVEAIYSFSASRSAVLGTFSNGKLAVWDFTKLVLQQPEYLP